MSELWSSQITFCKITYGETNQGENWHCGVTKVSIKCNIHQEGHPVSSYYVIAEFASVQIIFGATVAQTSLSIEAEQFGCCPKTPSR